MEHGLPKLAMALAQWHIGPKWLEIVRGLIFHMNVFNVNYIYIQLILFLFFTFDI